MKAVPKAGGNIIYKMLEITYSPITAREQQVSSSIHSAQSIPSSCLSFYVHLDASSQEAGMAKKAGSQE